jgi:hypothetical protein
MTDQTAAPAPAAPETPVAAPARRSFFKSTLGRVTLVGGVLVALGAGVAVAQQGWRHGGMMGGGHGMMGGGRGLERFCAADLSWVTQRMADGVTTRLNLTDAQKPALADLRATALRVGGEAKKLCAEKRDMATVPGRLAAASQGLAMANAAMGELKPKIEAFYATLNDEQKKQMDQMGPRGRRGGGMGGMGGPGMGGPGMGGPGMGGQGGPGMGQRGWRHGDAGEGMGPRGWRQGMTQQGERPAAQRDWN